jgi:membrane protein DedA with SNARE-associated domain
MEGRHRMSPQDIANLIVEYRYWILVPLAIVEGPIVAFIAGTAASLGYFNLYALMAVFFVRDMGMDAFYYYSGYFGWRAPLAKRMLRKISIEEGQLDGVRLLWEKHPARTMFVGKLSYGIAQAFIVVAGMVKMRLLSFFGYGALVAVAQYGTLLLLGYFFGSAFGGNAALVVQNIQYVIAGIIAIVSGYYVVRWYIRGKFPPPEHNAIQ